LDKGAYAPTRAHKQDAGWDLRAVKGQTIMPGVSAVFPTGVHVQLPEGTCGLLVSKSGLNTKHNITSTGLIDEGYTGEIVVKLYNHGKEPYVVNDGDKISQMVVLPIVRQEIEIVDDLDEKTERGNNGFGSSGK
jgi:dUTP pyrophosphatase